MCSDTTTKTDEPVYAKGSDPGLFTAEECIAAGEYATCRICEDVFRRRVETARYCSHCGNGFCEGQHGTFAYGHGVCIICGAKGKHRFGPRIYKSHAGKRVVW